MVKPAHIIFVVVELKSGRYAVFGRYAPLDFLDNRIAGAWGTSKPITSPLNTTIRTVTEVASLHCLSGKDYTIFVY
jgi:hypothetical protein